MTGPRVLAPAVRALFGSTTEAAAELQAADALLRSPLPVSRRIAVVALSGGSGCTAAATVLASVLATRRAGPVLAVDAAGGHAGLVRRLDTRASTTEHRAPGGGGDRSATASAGPALGTASSAVPEVSTLQQARAGLPQSAAGASVLDLAGTGLDRDQSPVPGWNRRVSPISRFFDLVVTDFGVRPEADDLAAAAATGQVVVLVSRADAHHARAAARTARRLRASSPAAVVLVLTDLARTPDRFPAVVRRIAGVPVHVLPHDSVWSTLPPAGPTTPTSRSRWAQLRLAAAVMTAAVQAPPSPVLRPGAAAERPHTTTAVSA